MVKNEDLMKVSSEEVGDEIVITEKTRYWCELPYPNHPNGCPNVGDCEATTKYVKDVFDMERNIWFVIVKFDIESFAERMKAKHPDWTKKQRTCLLYWQGSVESKLEDEAKKFVNKEGGTMYEMVPEGMGVNVFATMLKLGYPIETGRPEKNIFKVALVGYSDVLTLEEWEAKEDE